MKNKNESNIDINNDDKKVGGGWDRVFFPRLISLYNNELIEYSPGITWSLRNNDNKAYTLDGKEVRAATRNHIFMCLAAEYVRSGRAFRNNTENKDRHELSRSSILEFYQQERNGGIWGSEMLAGIPHDHYYTAPMGMILLSSIEFYDKDIEVESSWHWSALLDLWKLGLTPDFEVILPGRRSHSIPSHHDGTGIHRLLSGKRQEKDLSKDDGWFQPGNLGCRIVKDHIPLFVKLIQNKVSYKTRFDLHVEKFNGGHLAWLDGNEKEGDTTCDWILVRYGKNNQVEFGMNWQTPKPSI